MKRLEDIPKKNIFDAPEGYFDKLPGIIQARVAAESTSSAPLVSFGLVLRYALPVLAIGLAIFMIFRENDPSGSPEELLASVSTEQLSGYLLESDFSTEELLDNLDLNEVDVNASNEEIIDLEFDSDVLEEFAEELQLEL